MECFKLKLLIKVLRGINTVTYWEYLNSIPNVSAFFYLTINWSLFMKKKVIEKIPKPLFEYSNKSTRNMTLNITFYYYSLYC